jgi:hypothetical protein
VAFDYKEAKERAAQSGRVKTLPRVYQPLREEASILRWHIRFRKYPRSRRIRNSIIFADTREEAIRIFEEYNRDYRPHATLVSIFEAPKQPRRDVISSGKS